jgi:hypothetical protein
MFKSMYLHLHLSRRQQEHRGKFFISSLPSSLSRNRSNIMIIS